MNNYSKGVIYTIRYRNDDSLIYVGSTIQPLYKRWYKHKNDCFNQNAKNYNCNIYTTIRDTNDIDNWYIELYESFPCTNREELNKREGEVIRQIGNLNMVIAGRGKKEYREENKDKIKNKKKEYYEENKDKIKIRKQKYNEKNKEIIKEYSHLYREENKDKIKEYQKQYREENKDKIKKYYENNKTKV